MGGDAVGGGVGGGVDVAVGGGPWPVRRLVL